jgi:hypothetical protein
MHQMGGQDVMAAEERGELAGIGEQGIPTRKIETMMHIGETINQGPQKRISDLQVEIMGIIMRFFEKILSKKRKEDS